MSTQQPYREVYCTRISAPDSLHGDGNYVTVVFLSGRDAVTLGAFINDV